jgi:uncharacterized lipoprotein YmbA
MMSRISIRLVVTGLSLSIVAVGGCVNLGEGTKQSTRFYVLNASSSPGVQKQLDEGKECLAIGLGPVNIPEYLNRPQIVTRVGLNELKAAEFHRWAEPLRENVARVLGVNLSSLLCIKPLSLFPWKAATSIDYRIEVEVIRMDGNIGGDVELIARWSIYDRDRRAVLLSKETSYSETAGSKAYEALVSAQSRALAGLSRDIAEAFKAVNNMTNKGPP